MEMNQITSKCEDMTIAWLKHILKENMPYNGSVAVKWFYQYIFWINYCNVHKLLVDKYPQQFHQPVKHVTTVCIKSFTYQASLVRRVGNIFKGYKNFKKALKSDLTILREDEGWIEERIIVRYMEGILGMDF